MPYRTPAPPAKPTPGPRPWDIERTLTYLGTFYVLVAIVYAITNYLGAYSIPLCLLYHGTAIVYIAGEMLYLVSILSGRR